MARTVGGAFSEFRREKVDLDADETDQARTSRDYLYGQMDYLDRSNRDFPRLLRYVPYGSFSRKAKIRPLDDIDFFAVLDGAGVREHQNGYDSYLAVQDAACHLARFRDDSGYVSSIRVLNRIKSGLGSIGNYAKAEVRRNQEVVSLTLSSYPWTFDIAPALASTDWSGNLLCYLIPNGSGHWKRTNPDKDQEYITRVNKQQGGDFIPLLRLVKFWNRRRHKPALMSYYFETLALKTFDYAARFGSFQEGVKYFFDHCPNYVMSTCPDPKGLGPNLDPGLDYDTRTKVHAKMREAAEVAGYALYYERAGQQETAIRYWREVFGSEFPAYGW